MDKILQSQLLTYAVAGVFILLAILLFIYVARQLFGRRIRAPGPRNRPRRLDIVDAFDLDRERQLIIVRRDNIEHLLLIGGPNDVLVEGSILRGEPMAARTETRELRPSAPTPGWPSAPGAVETPPAPPPAIAPKPEPPREAPPLAARAPSREPPPAVLEMLRRRPAEPARRPEPAHSEPPLPELTPPEPVEAAPPPPPAPAPPPPPPRVGAPEPPPAARPTVGAPPLRPLSPRPPTPPFLTRTQKAAPPSPQPPPRREPPPVSQRPAAPPPSPPSPAPPPPSPPPAENDALESLEAEMARLLGRPEN
ncbi:MAG TPA: hypothetical protein VED87_02265 [Methylocystis sp.]|nr:hypothetical protein [Methylocystis sp.]